MIISEASRRKESASLSGLFYVKEESAEYTKHDLLFKRLLETFFAEFIEAFFPDMYGEIDFESIKYLSEEMVPRLRDGNERRLDIVVEVKWKQTDTIIVIHVEPQSYQQSNFNKRMFHYFSLLHQKVDKPILPIAIFSYEEPWDEDQFKMKIGQLDVLRFTYLTLHLRKMNWRDFVRKENPVSAALLSKMGYNERERIKVKIEFFRILTKLKIDLDKKDILVDFFQTYLQLSEQEEAILVEEVKKLEDADEILEIPNVYVERGKKIGREVEREAVALEMLRDGFSIEKVMRLTRLKKEQVEQLQKEQ